MNVFSENMQRPVEERCVRCCQYIKHDGVSCARCAGVRYCSLICLEEDRQDHKYICDCICLMKGRLQVLPDDEYSTVVAIRAKAKLLDCNGAYLSDSVILEAFYIQDSFPHSNNCFAIKADDSSTNVQISFPCDMFMKNDAGVPDSTTLRQDNHYLKQPFRNSNETDHMKGEPSFQSTYDKPVLNCHSSNYESFSLNRIKRGHFGDKLKELGISSMHNPRDDDDGQSFGKGWWNKGPRSGNRKKDSGEQSSRHACGGSDLKSGTQAVRRNGDSFGEGWWKGKLDTKSSGNSSQNSKLKEPVHKSENVNNNNRSNCHAISRCESTSSSHSSRRTENLSSSDDFGAGWWQKKKGIKRKRTSDETDKDCRLIDGKVASPSGGMEKKLPEVNMCQDILPYRSKKTKAMSDRFSKVAARIGSDLIEEEAVHGRVIRISLEGVPGLWKASLGGSRVSLLLEIVSHFPASQPAVLAQDVEGHTAPVLLNATYATSYSVPQLDYAVSYSLSKCLRPGNFILLRKVMWKELSNKKLAITMNDMELVEFIFYYLIDT